MRAKVMRITIVLLGLGLSLLAFQPAAADTGPKPTMSFEFTQAFAGAPVSIVDGSMLECQKADCSDGQPLRQLGPQHFTCQANSCNSLGYGYSPYLQLKIQFSDGKTRQSNVFQQAGFDSQYKVTIRPDDLLVEATPNLDLFSPLTWVLVCACLLGILLVVVLVIILLVRRRSRKA